MEVMKWLADKAWETRARAIIRVRERERERLSAALAEIRRKWIAEAGKIEKPGTAEEAERLVYRDWLALAIVPPEWQTLEMCGDAVRQEPLAVMFAACQSPEMCVDAVGKNPLAVCFVWEATPEMWAIAAGGKPPLLAVCDCQTPEVCLAAVEASPRALLHAERQDAALCAAALRKDPRALAWILDAGLAREMRRRLKAGLALDEPPSGEERPDSVAAGAG